jgi:ABC-2 type transport system permease protein
MIPANALSIANRIINQLIRDRRTMGLLVIAPLLIASIVGVSIPDKNLLDYTAPAMLAMLILFFGFLLTGISFQRERSQGTLERLMASPVSRLDIVGGYLLGFLLFALAQTMIIFFYMVYVLDVSFRGELWQILVFEAIIGVIAVCLGTFVSTFARNEFQITQFIPVIIIPQMFLCGLLWPVSQMPDYLQWIAKFLPLTYGIDGIRALMLQGEGLLDIGKEIGVLLAYTVVLLVLAALTLRRGISA